MKRKVIQIKTRFRRFSLSKQVNSRKNTFIINTIKISVLLSLLSNTVFMADATPDCNAGSASFSTECGANANASGVSSTASGDGSIASADNSIASGTSSSATIGSGATAIGAGSQTTSGTAIGPNAQALGGDFAGGRWSKADATGTVALGNRAYTS